VNAKKACAFDNAKVHWLHQTIKQQNVMKAYSEKNGCYYFGERVIIIFVFLLRWDLEGFKKKRIFIAISSLSVC
jgi:hypothetical protein